MLIFAKKSDMPRRLSSILFILFIFSLHLFSYGQVRVDSLLGIVKLGNNDTNSVNAYSDLCKEYGKVNSLKAFEYGQQGLIISQKIGYYKGAAKCFYNLGTVCFILADYPKSLDYFSKSLKVFTAIEQRDGAAYCLNAIGNLYSKKGNYAVSIRYYLKALKEFETLKNRSGLAICCNNIGSLYIYQKNYSDALKYLQKSLKTSFEIGDLSRGSSALINIGNVYYSQNKDSLALTYYLKALNYIDGSKNEKYSGCLINVGYIYFNMGNYSKAGQYFQKSLDYFNEIKNKNGISLSLNSFANIYKNIGKYDEAVEYALQSLKIAEEINAVEYKIDNAKILADCYYQKGNYKKAYEYHKLFKEINDSIYNIASSNQIKEIEAKYQSEKKEKEITVLQKEKEIQAATLSRSRILQGVYIAGIILVIIFSILFYSRYRHRQRTAIAKAVAQQEKLRFKEVIEAQEKERKRIAQDLHDSVGLLLSTTKLNLNELEDIAGFGEDDKAEILKNSIRLVTETRNEVRNISHNIMPGSLIELGLFAALRQLILKINTGNKLNIIMQEEGFSSRLPESVEINIYRIIQEILGNIIKHANANEVNITIENKNNFISLSIKDNGIGIDKSKIEQSEGIGWKNILSRVLLLNGKIDIESQKNSGTLIKIYFQLNQQS